MASMKYASFKPSNISKRKTVLQEEGGPVRRTFIGSFDTADLSKSFLISEYPTIFEKNFSSAPRSFLLVPNISILSNRFLNMI
jgi:hypothetical protein